MCSRNDDPSQNEPEPQPLPWDDPAMIDWLDRISVKGDPATPGTLHPVPWPWIHEGKQ